MGSQSVERAFEIIEYLAKQGSWVSLRTLARELNFVPSTAHRFLSTLNELGYVQKKEDTGQYRLSLKFAWFAAKVVDNMEITQVARPLMEDLVSKVNETLHLAVRDGIEFVYVAKVDGRQAVNMRSRIGDRGYLHSTAVGKCLIAFMDEPSRDEIINKIERPSLTKNTITSIPDLKLCLKDVRQRRYSVDDEENEIGIRCIGGPIFSHTGKIQAALSISGWNITMSYEKLSELVEPLMDTCREISVKLGYVYP